MIDIGIAALASQAISIQLDASFYEIQLRESNGVMAATIARDWVTLVTNSRVTAGTPLLPYRYQEAGNFIVTVDDDALPYWDQFGVTQFLVYLSADELAAYRSA